MFPYFCYKQAYTDFIRIGRHLYCAERQLENSPFSNFFLWLVGPRLGLLFSEITIERRISTDFGGLSQFNVLDGAFFSQKKKKKKKNEDSHNFLRDFHFFFFFFFFFFGPKRT